MRLLIAVLLSVSPLAHGEFFAVPGAARLEGVGLIYGAAAGAKNLAGERLDLMAGVSGGEVEAQGLAVADVPIGLPFAGLTLGFVNLSQARFNTAYARGLETAPLFRQEVSGQFLGGGLEFRLLEERLKFGLGLVQSEIRLDDYYVGDERVIRPNKSGYHPVKTSSNYLNVSYKQELFYATLAAVTATGRTGQSDTLTATYTLGGEWPALSRVTLAGRARWSDAYVTKQEKRYLDEASVRSALNTGCAAAGDATEQARCQTLENSLASYVARNNLNGTAAPAGGSTGVKAFDEMSLRAGHTRVVSLEARYQAFRWLELAPTFDWGWSHDDGGKVFDKAVHSYGAALRSKIKDITARLAYAQTHDQSAWFLTFER